MASFWRDLSPAWLPGRRGGQGTDSTRAGTAADAGPKRRRLSIAARLYCVAVLSVLSVGTLSGAALHFASVTEQGARRLEIDAYSGVERSARLQLLLEKHRRVVESAPAELDRTRLKNSRQSLDDLVAQIAVLVDNREIAPDRRHKAADDLADGIARQLPTLAQYGREVVALAENYAQDQALELAQGGYDRIADALQNQISTYRRQRLAIADEATASLLASAKALLYWVSFSTAAALLLIGPLAILITRGVLRRLARITDAMMLLARNETGTEIPSRGDPDEVGDMARAVQVFKANAIELLDRKADLETVNRQFDAALTNMPHGLCMYDAANRLVVSNHRFQEIYSLPDEAVTPGVHFRRVVEIGEALGNYRGRTVDEVLRERETFIRQGLRGEFVQELPDGRVISISHVPLASGGWLATYEDVTARRKAEEELRTAKDKAELADRAKTEFLATMSHEIRTPLNGILGYTDLLLDQNNLARPQKRYLKHIQTAGSMLLTVVNDILDFSKIEAGQIELEPQVFSPLALIDSAISIIQSAADQKSLDIRFETPGNLPARVLGDQDRLRQILLNLLNNAVKFTPKGSIVLALESLPAPMGLWRARFSVKDTGIGIPPEKIGRLFERFSQIDGSIRREFGGTGLGLAISKQLVELMGGTIGVESEPGQGSTFWFTLLLPQVERDVQAKHEARDAAPARRSAAILLVDDTEINREVAQIVLETAGHRVDPVNDGADAIAAVQSKAYDLVLMDIQMPGMDGITATRRIRALPGPERHIPIVAMTANVLPQQVAEFKAAGMNDHVGKPFRREQLLATIESCLGTGPAPEPEAAPETPLFDRTVYGGLLETMGAETMDRLLDRLLGQLDGCLADQELSPDERSRLAKDVHGLVSAAGLLGFSALSAICREVEQACRGDGDLASALQRFREARAQTVQQIAALRSAA